MSTDGFRGPQVCRIVGITYRQLDYWVRTDLIHPSIADARGSGTQRRWSFADLLELAIVKALLDAGVELARTRRVLDEMRRHEHGTGAYLLLIGRRIDIYASVADLVDGLLAANDVGVVLPVAGLAKQLEEATAREHERTSARTAS